MVSVLYIGIFGGLILSILFFLIQEGHSEFSVSIEISKPQPKVFEYFQEFDFINYHPFLKGVEFHQLIEENVRDFRYMKDVIYLFGVFKIVFPPGIIRFTRISNSEVNYISKPRVFDLFDLVFFSKIKILETETGTKIEETVIITGPKFLCYLGKQFGMHGHGEMMKKVREIV